MRINGDGSIRLIYDGLSCQANGQSIAESIAVTNQAYNSNYNNSYVGWTYTSGNQRPVDNNSATSSNIKSKLESWYNTNLESFESKIADGKFCNDRNVGAAPSNWYGTYATTWSATGTQFAYVGAKRIYETFLPTLSCSTGDIYTLKVGLITADEVMMAGGKNNNNTNYYLYNGQNYWTMTPSSCSSGDVNVFFINFNGSLVVSDVTYSFGMRPVINLRSDVTISGGNGTQNNPYIID